MKTPEASIIILNWNGLNHLQECLESLAKQSFKDFECILVDNGSTDGSLDFLASNHKWVKLVKLPNNLGFAKGNNIGLKHSNGRYIVTLNNDTVSDKHWLAELVKIAKQHPEAGMVASRICSYFNQDVIDSLGLKICLDGMSRGAFRGQKYSTLRSIPQNVLLPSACAALYKKEMLDQTGFFDESFFAYCEDTDLGLRGRRLGWKAILARNAVVYHKYSMTGGSFSPFKIYLVERNHFWCTIKNFPTLLLLILPITTFIRYLFQCLIAISGQGSGKDFKSSHSQKSCISAFLRGILHGIFHARDKIHERFFSSSFWKISDDKMTKEILVHRLSFPELFDARNNRNRDMT